MKSVESYKKEIELLKAEGKEHRRTQQIKQLKNEIKDLELVIDVLKQQFISDKRFELEVSVEIYLTHGIYMHALLCIRFLDSSYEPHLFT
jgi:hypothetical protein